MAILSLALIHACLGAAPGKDRGAAPPVYGYQVVHAYPHDPRAFCQGLVYADGLLYEGTGLYGQSTLRKVELATGRVVQAVRLNPDFFGEGITLWEDQVVQLTWKNGTALVFDKQSLAYRRNFAYQGEGWGLTHDGTRLIMSDGTNVIRFLDPKTFRVTGRLAVTSGGRAVGNLNELEYAGGELLANVWGTDYIARISLNTGEVTGWINLTGLLPQRSDPDAVLNGIAFDSQGGRLFVTGKNWPKLFEIRLVAPNLTGASEQVR